ncbi:MAG: glutamate racemase [Hyphomicrobiales bacterium]|nr:glutamate racemase [Hyphomicrobiales bacterium]
MPAPRILVFDSGLGGLTVFREIARAAPAADFVYCADDAAFPYGAWPAEDLVWRVVAVFRRLVADIAPDVAVVACNTASTLVLPHLRAAFPKLPFVGTVPAVKPAAERSRSKMISVLATPGTVARDYTRDLIASFAAHCAVELVGSQHLARLAEDFMHGAAVPDAEIAREIAPCFVRDGDARTDEIVLACTHYPLLLAQFERLAPWPVEWIDPAPAIARRVVQVLADRNSAVRDEVRSLSTHRALFTSGRAPDAALSRMLLTFGLAPVECAPIPVEQKTVA